MSEDTTVTDGGTELDDRERRALEVLCKRLGDDEFVIAERYTEWQVRAPTLESDLAQSNIAQDELGHARLWYDVLRELDIPERDLIFERDPGDFRHATLTERPFPDGDWADAIVRSYLYDAAEEIRLAALEDSSHPKIADRVGKIQGEEDYHLEHARNWLERLAADEEGLERLQDALDRLFSHALTLFEPVDPDVEDDILDLGYRTETLPAMGEQWLSTVVPFLESLGLAVSTSVASETEFVVDDSSLPDARGRDGSHTDNWFELHDELTATYRDLERTDTTRIMERPDS